MKNYFSFYLNSRWGTGWGSLAESKIITLLFFWYKNLKFMKKNLKDGAVSQFLMQVSMPFLTDARCLSRYSEVNTQSQVCAGEIGQNKDTCQVINNLFII